MKNCHARQTFVEKDCSRCLRHVLRAEPYDCFRRRHCLFQVGNFQSISSNARGSWTGIGWCCICPNLEANSQVKMLWASQELIERAPTDWRIDQQDWIVLHAHRIYLSNVFLEMERQGARLQQYYFSYLYTRSLPLVTLKKLTHGAIIDCGEIKAKNSQIVDETR